MVKVKQLGHFVLRANDIEIFYEMPKSSWPKDGYLFAGDFPDSLDGIEAKKLTDAEIISSS